MIAVILSEKNQGIQSSEIQFCFWGALVIYAGIKLRSLILISRDQVLYFVALYVYTCKHVSTLLRFVISENLPSTY